MRRDRKKPLYIILLICVLVSAMVVGVYAGIGSGGETAMASAPLAQRNTDGAYLYSPDTGDRVAGLGIGDADPDSIRYLSDLYGTGSKVYSFVTGKGGSEVSAPREFKLNENFSGKCIVFTAPSQAGRREVNSSNSPRTLTVDGKSVTYTRNDIVLGAKGLKFEKGLGFLTSNPKNTSIPPATLIYDLRDMDADYFYAVVGMLGSSNTEANAKNKVNPVTYKVYGSKAASYESADAAKNATDFVELASIGDINFLYTGEFNVNISGYTYLKLTAQNMGTSNAGTESAWANACVYKLATTTAGVNVSWDHKTMPEAQRPTELTVQLYQDGTAVDGKTATLNAGNGWTYQWEDLPKYQEGTLTEITYTVSVVTDPDFYRKSVSGNTVTYTYDATLITADVPVSVTWDDGATQGGNRPAEVKVQLCADGTEVEGAVLTLNGENAWAGKFEKQPVYAEGGTNAIVYTLKILTESNFYDLTADGCAVTGAYIPMPETGYTVNVAWVDHDNALGFRPRQVTLQLYADGVAVDGKTGTADENGGWSCEWTALPMYNAQRTAQITYSAQPEEVPDQYEMATEGTTVTFHCVPTVDFPVTAQWEDGENKGGTRPDSVTVQLYADGQPVAGKTATLNEENDWAYTWEKLPKCQSDDITEIVYTFSASSVSNYEKAVTGGSVVYTHVASNAVKFGNLGKTATLAGLPSDATHKNTYFLSDLTNGHNSRVVDQFVIGENNSLDARTFRAFRNYEGQVQVFYGSGPSQQLVTATSDVGGATYHPDDIVLGAKGKVYADGISFMASPATGPDAYIIYDLRGLDADYFYAVTGITGTANDLFAKNCYLNFEVWGSKNDSADGFVKLAYSENIRSYLVNEFKVAISGYKYLKLVVRNTGATNAGASGAWANACVYTMTPGPSGSGNQPGGEQPGGVQDVGDPSRVLNYTPSVGGKYTGIVNAAAGSIVDLSDARFVTESYILPSASNPNRTVRIDTTDLNQNTPGVAVIGEANTKFKEHLTLHPTELTNSRKAYAILDVKGLNCDRLYAAVGISAESGKTAGKGVIFSVYGYNETAKQFVLIGSSSDVHGKESGEFTVNISGYQKLKLVVNLASDSKDHYSRTASWCNISAYRYDPNGIGQGGTEDPGQTGLPGKYTPSSSGAYTGVKKAQGGKVTYLSEMKYTASSNNNNNPTTNNYPYGGKSTEKIIVGSKDTAFAYGLGVHPKAGTAESYTVYDVSDLGCDRFYSVVGITNAKGKAGASQGVIFSLYADYEGNGSYQKLAESETVTGKKSGEFDVDITGAKSLKLAVVSATGNHASSGSAWANACVYKYDPNGSAPAGTAAVGVGDNTPGTNDLTGLAPAEGFTPSTDGEYVSVEKKYSKSVIFLSEIPYLDSSNSTNTEYPAGQPTTLDYVYNSKTDLICIGEMDRVFFTGLGMHPKDPSKPVDGTIESWTTYDVSGYDCDRFHAAVGITNEKGKEGASKGVVFRVYGDYGDGNYQLLSHSGAIIGRMSGEFDLDITGVKNLKVAVVSAGAVHTSSAVAWADARLYSTQNPQEIPAPTDPVIDDEPTGEPTEPVAADEESGSPVIGIVIALAVLLVAGVAAAIVLLLRRRKNKV